MLSNPLLFAHCCCHFKNVDMFESYFSIKLQCQLIGIKATVCKKQWIWQLLQKNRRKMSIIDLTFQNKKFVVLTCMLVWNLPSKSPLQSLIFCEIQILSYSVNQSWGQIWIKSRDQRKMTTTSWKSNPDTFVTHRYCRLVLSLIRNVLFKLSLNVL